MASYVRDKVAIIVRSTTSELEVRIGTGCWGLAGQNMHDAVATGESSSVGVKETFVAIVLPPLMHLIWICDCPRQQHVTSRHIENCQ